MEAWVEPGPKAEAIAQKLLVLLDKKASEEAAVKKVKKGGQTPFFKPAMSQNAGTEYRSSQGLCL